jgi:hypothetical protein
LALRVGGNHLAVEHRACSLCLKRPVHRALADGQAFGDLSHGETLRVERFDLKGFAAYCRLSAFVFSCGFCLCNAFSLTLKHHLAFELRDAS